MTQNVRCRALQLSPSNRQEQHGVVLIVGLILLIVMSLLGLTSIKLATMDERMVTAAYDRNLAFQAAESALREVEALIDSTGRPAPAADAACSLMGTPPVLQTCGVITNPATSPRWLNSTSSDWVSATAVSTANASATVTITPQYFVEYLGNTFPCELISKPPPEPAPSETCLRYRVTSRVMPPSDEGRAASVMLQSMYSTHNN
jgi:type IV pilus assembly protein PilX